MTDTRLKNCPFCGGEPMLFDADKGYCYVKCPTCFIVTCDYYDAATAIAAWNRRTPPAVPEGWVLVPKEPTREMAIAAAKALDDITVDDPKAAAWDAMRAYRAMLSAAPTPPVDDGWRPIETAPKDGTRFWGKIGDDAIAMLWHPKFNAFVSAWRRMTMVKGYMIDGDASLDHSPIIEHPEAWMPLPAPPKVKEE